MKMVHVHVVVAKALAAQESVNQNAAHVQDVAHVQDAADKTVGL